MAGKLLKRWRLVLGATVIIGVIVLTYGGNGAGGASGPCTMRVTADSLNVRSGPDSRDPVVERLGADAVVSADLATRNGYRQLAPDRWAAQLYLEPMPGSDCS